MLAQPKRDQNVTIKMTGIKKWGGIKQLNVCRKKMFLICRKGFNRRKEYHQIHFQEGNVQECHLSCQGRR